MAFSRLNRLRSGLGDFPGLCAPVRNLLCAERHGFVNASNIFIAKCSNLRKSDDALLCKLILGNRADTLDLGQVISFTFGSVKSGAARRVQQVLLLLRGSSFTAGSFGNCGASSTGSSCQYFFDRRFCHGTDINTGRTLLAGNAVKRSLGDQVAIKRNGA